MLPLVLRKEAEDVLSVLLHLKGLVLGAWLGFRIQSLRENVLDWKKHPASLV